MSKIEFNQLIIESEKILFDYQKNFHILLNKNLNQTKNDREKNFELLRPTFGHPGKKDHLENIDNQEKLRQIRVGRSIDQLRLDTIVKTKKSNFLFDQICSFIFRMTYKQMLKERLRSLREMLKIY